jgi:hypothetical protein
MRVEAEGGQVRIGIRAHFRLVPALRAALQHEQRARDERAAAARAPPGAPAPSPHPCPADDAPSAG